MTLFDRCIKVVTFCGLIVCLVYFLAQLATVGFQWRLEGRSENLEKIFSFSSPAILFFSAWLSFVSAQRSVASQEEIAKLSARANSSARFRKERVEEIRRLVAEILTKANEIRDLKRKSAADLADIHARERGVLRTNDPEIVGQAQVTILESRRNYSEIIVATQHRTQEIETMKEMFSLYLDPATKDSADETNDESWITSLEEFLEAAQGIGSDFQNGELPSFTQSERDYSQKRSVFVEYSRKRLTEEWEKAIEMR